MERASGPLLPFPVLHHEILNNPRLRIFPNACPFLLGCGSILRSIFHALPGGQLLTQLS